MSPLIGVPLFLVSVALLWPLVALDGGRAYVVLLASQPDSVAAASACWLSIVYWLVRRVSSAVLLRVSGDKVRVRDDG